MSSPSYLLPLSKATEIPAKALSALEDIESQFHLSDDKLGEILDQFLWEFGKGLSEKGTDANRDTFMPMIPTYIQTVPDGTETGTYLALDLGGTNLRVCEVTFLGEHKWTMKQQKYKVSEALKVGEVTALFDYIAGSVDHFLTEIGTQASEDSDRVGLGFTFSFPVQQTALDAGTLINWTKGFECTGAIGKDVVQLLQDALDRKHIHVRCNALVNDTAGTLMARGYEGGSCICGGIFGTGTNGALYLPLSQMTKMDHGGKVEKGEKAGVALDKMIVNTEWGAFDNERKVMPFTLFDNRVDRISINPRKQAFEKMISGMYLGELTRNVVLHLVDKQIIFQGHSSKALNAHYGLDTALMSALEASSSSLSSDPIPSIRKVILEDLEIPSKLISDSDCILVARVSEIVGTRGARLSAVSLAAVVKQIGLDQPGSGPVEFGLDGSLVEFYPRFEERIRCALKALLGEEVEGRCVIKLAKDGSGVGGALTSMAAGKEEKVLKK